MAKFTINDITSGYASTTALNTAFNAIESEFQNKVLYRNNPAGEPNTMENDLDFNSNDILNVGTANVTSLVVNGIDLTAQVALAQTYATNAATSATAAASSATAAASSATAAASSAASAAAYVDTFDDLYLGAKATNPTLDNDGNALQDGALYFDTTNDVMKVYDLGTTTWYQLTPSAANQANINTVAGIASDVTAVAAVASDVSAIAAIDANVTGVANISSDVTTVANIASDVTTFSTFYLGAHASAPTTSVTGAFYYNTTSSGIFIWNGSAWVTAVFDASGAVTSFNTRTGAVTLSSGDVTTALTYTPVNKTGDTMTGTLTATRLTASASTASLDLISTSNIFSRINFGDAGDSDIGQIYYDHPNNTMKLYTNNTERLTINSTGDVAMSSTGALKVPVGTDAQRPTAIQGQIRYNTTGSTFEGYDGSAWGAIGGGASAGGAIYENKDDITANYTITSGSNGFSVGPMTIASGVSVTVPSGQRWVVL